MNDAARGWWVLLQCFVTGFVEHFNCNPKIHDWQNSRSVMQQLSFIFSSIRSLNQNTPPFALWQNFKIASTLIDLFIYLDYVIQRKTAVNFSILLTRSRLKRKKKKKKIETTKFCTYLLFIPRWCEVFLLSLPLIYFFWKSCLCKRIDVIC